MKSKLLIISIIALCLSTTAVRADMNIYSFTFDSLQTTWTQGTSTFTADKTTGSLGTTGSVTRWLAPTGKAVFDWTVAANIEAARGNNSLLGDFQLTMTLSNITATSADAVGSFTIWDVSDNGGTPADTIYGDIVGVWTQDQYGALKFDGLLSNVDYTDPVPGNFDGHTGSVEFTPPPPPWAGSVVQITATAPWFTINDFDVTGGSIDATIIPVPGAILLGILGLSVAGLKLRKYA